MNVKRKTVSTRRATMLCLLLSVLAGCSANSIPSGSSSESIPPLTALGRQPEKPAYCLPTCSANLSNEIDSWQTSLTGLPPPEPPAKGSMTP